MNRTLAATYLPRYELTALEGEPTIKGLTLYEATKALVFAVERGVVSDATHIARNGRAVGFWCFWRETPRAMFQAMDDERDQLNG